MDNHNDINKAIMDMFNVSNRQCVTMLTLVCRPNEYPTLEVTSLVLDKVEKMKYELAPWLKKTKQQKYYARVYRESFDKFMFYWGDEDKARRNANIQAVKATNEAAKRGEF